MRLRQVLAAGAVTAVAMCAWVVPAGADTQIDISPPFNPTSGYDTVGEVVTVPAGDTRLTTFSLFATGNGDVRGEVYAWDGTKAAGPALYESPLVNVSTAADVFQELTFPTGGIDLTAGSQYVLFLTRAAAKGGTGTPNFGYTFVESYAGGGFAGRFTGDNPADWTTTTWNFTGPPGVEAAVRATFTAPQALNFGGFNITFPPENCGNGSDDDFDGQVDAADSDCPPPAATNTGIVSTGTGAQGNGTPGNSPTPAPPGSPAARTAFRASLLASKASTECLAGPCLAPGASHARAAAARRGSVHRVAVTGRYRGRPCGGNVRLTYRLKGTRAAKRTAKIGNNCRYRKKIKLKVSARTKIGATLRISQRFTGTKTVTAGNGKTLRVKLRRR